MMTAQRRSELKKYMLEHKSASVLEMARRFSVSGQTIRRDFEVLENEGFLLRSYGGAVTLIVVLIDFGKTVAACLLATLFLPRDPLLAKIVAGAGVQLGHVFPVFFGFHGGKGILCGAAIALVTDWRVFAVAMPVFILLFFATRLVSLASLTAVACFGVLYAVFYPARPEIWIITICEAAFAFVMHRGNIVRLLHGQERKTYFHRAKNERNE